MNSTALQCIEVQNILTMIWFKVRGIWKGWRRKNNRKDCPEGQVVKMLTEKNVQLRYGTISSPPPCYQGEDCAIKSRVLSRCINSLIKARPPPSHLPIGRARRGAI